MSDPTQAAGPTAQQPRAAKTSRAMVGRGCAVRQVYQITWRTHTAFVYNLTTFEVPTRAPPRAQTRGAREHIRTRAHAFAHAHLHTIARARALILALVDNRTFRHGRTFSSSTHAHTPRTYTTTHIHRKKEKEKEAPLLARSCPLAVMAALMHLSCHGSLSPIP